MNINEIVIATAEEWGGSYEILHQVIYKAHNNNRERGLFYTTSLLSGTQIKEKISDGITFVALRNDEVVGTASVIIKIGKNWYDKGLQVAHYCLDAVLPEYQGCGIMKKMDEYRNAFSISRGAKLIRSGTAEGNLIQRTKFRRQGFKAVDCLSIKGNSFYSVMYAKWIDKTEKPPALLIAVNYFFRSIKTKALYLKGGNKRFGR